MSEACPKGGHSHGHAGTVYPYAGEKHQVRWGPDEQGRLSRFWEVLALGAGVQSTTVLLMSLEGELPKLDFAVFSDTQGEPEPVYEHLEWLEGVAKASGIQVIRTTKGSLEESLLSTEHQSAIPAFVKKADGKRGILRRYCTLDYKIAPKTVTIRQMIGASTRGRVNRQFVRQWFGISWDESERMTDSHVAYVEHHYPLIDLRMTRADCLVWLEAHGYPEPPRSACRFCPFHSDDEWVWLRDNAPVDFEKAVAFDAKIRTGQLHGVEGEVYLHDSLVPLGEAVFSRAGGNGRHCEADCAT